MENFTAAIRDFLSERGHLCLAWYDWPINVTAQDQAQGTRDALQLSVLEKLGLVVGKDMDVQSADSSGQKIFSHVRQYQLTAEGQKYYLHIPVVVATATTRVTHPADFCVATLTLDKIVGWEPPVQQHGQTVTSVVYTYKVEPAPWARTPDVQRVFPMVRRIVEGQGVMQLREGVRLTPQGWVADELFAR